MNGNINGVISFKIRDNGENMKDKLEEVKGKLKSEMGLEVQEKKEKAKNNPKL